MPDTPPPARSRARAVKTEPPARLSISSQNYSSWSLRGWLMCRFSGLRFELDKVALDAPGARAELLLLAPSILVPCLTHRGIRVWDTLGPRRPTSTTPA